MSFQFLFSMKKIISLQTLFLLFFVSCVRNPICTSQNSSSSIIYLQIDSLCGFFPTEGTKTEMHLQTRNVDMDDTLTCLESSCYEFFEVVKKKNLHCDYDSLITFVNNNALQTLNDKSIYIAFKDRKLFAMDILDEEYSNAELQQIMPDFNDLYSTFIETPWADTSTRTGLVSGYTFYVIKSGNTLALNERWNVQRKWLPAHLQHGYRSGIAINPNNDYIVFWCIAW